MKFFFLLTLPLLVHEIGHLIAALLCGSRLNFKFAWGRLWKIPIPRCIWAWDSWTKAQTRFVCQAGFLLELGLLPFMPWQYQAVAIIHFAIYPWYAGEVTDFKGMI